MQYIELNRVGPIAQIASLFLASCETMWLKRGSFTRISSCYSDHIVCWRLKEWHLWSVLKQLCYEAFRLSGGESRFLIYSLHFFLFKEYWQSSRWICFLCTAAVSAGKRRATASKPVSAIEGCSVCWHGNSSVSAHNGKHWSLLRACRWLLPVAIPVSSSKKLTRRRPCFIHHTVWVPSYRLPAIH